MSELPSFKKCDFYNFLPDSQKAAFEDQVQTGGMPSEHNGWVNLSPEERISQLDQVTSLIDDMPAAIKDLPLPKIKKEPLHDSPKEAATEAAPAFQADSVTSEKNYIDIFDPVDDARAQLEAHFLLEEVQPDAESKSVTTASQTRELTPEQPLLPPDLVLEAKQFVEAQAETTPQPEVMINEYVEESPKLWQTPEPEQPASSEYIANQVASGPDKEVAVATEPEVVAVRDEPMVPPVSSVAEPAQPTLEVRKEVQPDAELESMEKSVVEVVAAPAPELTAEPLPTPPEVVSAAEENERAYDEIILPAPLPAMNQEEVTIDVAEWTLSLDHEEERAFQDIPETAAELLMPAHQAEQEQVVELHDTSIIEGELIELYDRASQHQTSAMPENNLHSEDTILQHLIEPEVADAIMAGKTEAEPNEQVQIEEIIHKLETAVEQLVLLEQSQQEDQPERVETEELELEASVRRLYDQLLEHVGVEYSPDRAQRIEALVAAVKVHAIQVDDSAGTHENKRLLHLTFSQQATQLQELSTRLGKLIIEAIRNSTAVSTTAAWV